MSLRLIACSLAVAVLFAGSLRAAEENCSDEIQAIETDVEKGSPKASRSDSDDLEIELALAGLEVLCDPFDEWEIEGPEAQKRKDELIATLRKHADQDDADGDNVDF